MTHEEHKERHKLLHKMIDELVADWIDHNYITGEKSLSKTPIIELVKWSYEQTINPTEKP